MERFYAKLCDGDRVLFRRTAGYLAGASGRLDIHQGGILAGDVPTGRPYRLVLDDGRTRDVHITKVLASNSAGIARLEFHAPGDWLQNAPAAEPQTIPG